MAGIYVHLPFCRVHCAYCPFVVSTDLRLQRVYIQALLREIGRRSAALDTQARGAETIYFGGGTPSRTSPENLVRVAAAIRAGFEVEPVAEFTLEANPEDVTAESIAVWRSIGVNRLSIGVQSFHDSELQAIGRVHGADRAESSVRMAVEAGFRTSLDLILGLPGQSAESYRGSLKRAIDTGAGHISVYMLDLDEETALKRRVESGLVRVPDDDLVGELYVETVATLEQSGLAQYEISNFARPGEQSRHNLAYWRRQPYYGFGVGAHSFAGERRFANSRDIHRYNAGADEPEIDETLGEVERRHETLFLRLRQTVGLNYSDLLELGGEEASEWIEDGVSEGWLRRDDSRVAFTPAGFLVSSELLSRLF